MTLEEFVKAMGYTVERPEMAGAILASTETAVKGKFAGRRASRVLARPDYLQEAYVQIDVQPGEWWFAGRLEYEATMRLLAIH